MILGLGTAHMPPDFELYGRPREHRGAILDELMDVIEACWSNEPFDYEGRFFQRKGHVTPAPYSRTPIWIGAHGPKGLKRAAERADAWVCDPQRDIDTVARLADEYRAHGGEQVVLFREAWIGDDAEAVWAPHAMKVHRLYYNVGVYRRGVRAVGRRGQGARGLHARPPRPGPLPVRRAGEVRATAADWLERTGADYLALRLRHPTGPSHEDTLGAIERFGRELIQGSDGHVVQRLAVPPAEVGGGRVGVLEEGQQRRVGVVRAAGPPRRAAGTGRRRRSSSASAGGSARSR